MIFDYRWNPAMGLWVVVRTRTDQILSTHWTIGEAVNFIRSLEVQRDKTTEYPEGHCC